MAFLEQDIEKIGETKISTVNVSAKSEGGDGSLGLTASQSLEGAAEHEVAPTPIHFRGKLGQWQDKFERFTGLEARGITRVLPQDRHAGGIYHYIQMFLLWFGLDVVLINVVTGLLGPLVFSLGWVDTVWIMIFGSAIGGVGPSYTATFGPESGNRTMVSFTSQDSRRQIDISVHLHWGKANKGYTLATIFLLIKMSLDRYSVDTL